MVTLGAGRTAVAVAAGLRHTCAVLDTGELKCWGDGGNGKLGYDSTSSVGAPISSVPAVNLGAGRTAVAVSVGGAHSCALLDMKRALFARSYFS